jgi:hypothetical protein
MAEPPIGAKLRTALEERGWSYTRLIERPSYGRGHGRTRLSRRSNWRCGRLPAVISSCRSRSPTSTGTCTG